MAAPVETRTSQIIAATIAIADGVILRYGPDELAEFQLLSCSFDTQMPGGFGPASITIPRDPDLSARETKRYLLADVTIYGEGYRVAWMGRVAEVPQVGIDTVELACEGYSAELEDDATFREAYIDRDLNYWTGMTRYAKEVDLFFNITVFDPSVDVATDFVPCLRLGFDGAWTNQADCRATYDAGSLGVGEVIWDRGSDATPASSPSAAFSFEMMSTADGLAAVDTTGDLHTAVEDTDTGASLEPSSAERYLVAHWSFSPGGGLSGNQYFTWLTNLSVHGRHGLTAAGTHPDQGYLASQVVADVVDRQTDLPVAYIEDSSFVIKHLVFREPTTAQAVIEQVTAFAGGDSLVNDWGCYEDGFFWATPGRYNSRLWRVRMDEAVEPQDEGATSVGLCNGVMVYFTDTAGTAYSVGPPGSGASTESDLLADGDPENPFNRAGKRAWISVDAGMHDEDAALIIGRLALLEANADRRAGSVKIVGAAVSRAGTEYPAFMVRAGDRVIVEDSEDTRERRVLSTSFDGADTVTATVGSLPSRLDALLARLTSAIESANF